MLLQLLFSIFKDFNYTFPKEVDEMQQKQVQQKNSPDHPKNEKSGPS